MGLRNGYGKPRRLTFTSANRLTILFTSVRIEDNCSGLP
jgi:hypothetical protein